MFTGLVEDLAPLLAVVDEPPGQRLVIRTGFTDAQLGESIAVSGCCLTVVQIENQCELAFEAGPETLARTTLGRLKTGDRVNLERALRVGDRLGGHFVTGHVDAVAQLIAREDQADWSTLWFSLPESLAPLLVSKGSIAVDGVSLTLVDVRPDRFSVALIPHTLAATTLGGLQAGSAVNLETDLLAKHVQKLLAER